MAATYSEHMTWCKQRALEYVDSGDLINAIASFASDIRKDECTDTATNAMLVAGIGIPLASAGDVAGMRTFIEGFNC